jgi:tRNA A37 threonylcarbamoyladenosine biosynthesis protein TsaE
MAKNKDEKWREFEKYVAQLYSELGSIEVSHDINIQGNQIDVYAMVPVFDGTYNKAVVSCKCYKNNVGVSDIREWHLVTRSLIDSGNADIGVIVSANGFTQDAQALGKRLGIKLIPIETLRWASINFKPYLEAMVKNFSNEPVFSNKYYIPMRLQYDGTKEIVSVENAINKFLDEDANMRLFLLLGDFGAGKTTVCKYHFKEIAKDFLYKKDFKRVPIYVNLRDYPQHLNIQSMITHLLVNQYRTRCPGFVAVERLLQEGRILVFLDAFDEMTSRASYQTTLQNFHAIRNLLVGRAKVILTCRTHYFKSRDEIGKTIGGTELYKMSIEKGYGIGHLQGFNHIEIKKYIDMVCASRSNEYYEHIKNTYNLLGIAERPILLDMIAEVLPQLISKKQNISGGTLYQMYTSYWLERDDWRTSLSSTLREKFTIAFAESMYRQKKTRFTWREVEDAISEHWSGYSRKELEYYQYDIRTCSFIKMIPETEEYMFIHDSFAEFFVSSYLYQMLNENNPQPFIMARHSPEIIGFLCDRPLTSRIKEYLIGWLQNIADVNLVSNSISLLSKWENNLINLILNNIRIEDIEIRDTIISDLKLERVRFNEAKFHRCKISKTIFCDCNINTSNFFETILQSTTFENCELNNCTLNLSQTRDVKITGGNISRCDFTGAHLNEVIFTNTSFLNNIWTFDCFEGAKFDDVIFADYDKKFILSILSKIKERKWKSPPLLKNAKLDREIIKQFINHGAQINEEL